MESPTEHERHPDRFVLLFLFALFLLISPAKGLWSGVDAVWYAPYLVWGGIIVLAAWLRRRSRHDL